MSKFELFHKIDLSISSFDLLLKIIADRIIVIIKKYLNINIINFLSNKVINYLKKKNLAKNFVFSYNSSNISKIFFKNHDFIHLKIAFIKVYHNI